LGRGVEGNEGELEKIAVVSTLRASWDVPANKQRAREDLFID